jgi:hypothetical protein
LPEQHDRGRVSTAGRIKQVTDEGRLETRRYDELGQVSNMTSWGVARRARWERWLKWPMGWLEVAR